MVGVGKRAKIAYNGSKKHWHISGLGSFGGTKNMVTKKREIMLKYR